MDFFEGVTVVAAVAANEAASVRVAADWVVVAAVAEAATDWVVVAVAAVAVEAATDWVVEVAEVDFGAAAVLPAHLEAVVVADLVVVVVADFVVVAADFVVAVAQGPVPQYVQSDYLTFRGKNCI